MSDFRSESVLHRYNCDLDDTGHAALHLNRECRQAQRVLLRWRVRLERLLREQWNDDGGHCGYDEAPAN